MSEVLIGECPNCRKEMIKNKINKDCIIYYCEHCNIFESYIPTNKYRSIQGENCTTYIPLCLSVTRDQQKKLDIINKVLCTDFTPYTVQEASNIIEKYYPQAKQRFQNHPITNKQLAYIQTISTDLNIFCLYKKFDKLQASEWLERYVPIHNKYDKGIIYPCVFEDSEYECAFNEILEKFDIHSFDELKSFFNNDELLKIFLLQIKPYENNDLFSISGYTNAIEFLKKIKKINENNKKDENEVK